MGEFKNFAVIFFLIGATLAQEEDSSTKLCNNEEGKVFFAKLNACSDLARQNLWKNIIDSSIYKTSLPCSKISNSGNGLCSTQLLNILDSSIRKTSCDVLAARVNMIICFLRQYLNDCLVKRLTYSEGVSL